MPREPNLPPTESRRPRSGAGSGRGLAVGSAGVARVAEVLQGPASLVAGVVVAELMTEGARRLGAVPAVCRDPVRSLGPDQCGPGEGPELAVGLEPLPVA